MSMMHWICLVTAMAFVIGLIIAVNVTISDKNAEIATLNGKLNELQKQANNNHLAYELIVQNNEDNANVEEIVNECKEKLEANATNNADWYSEPLPDGVRDVFINCICALDDPSDASLRDPTCSEKAGDQ